MFDLERIQEGPQFEVLCSILLARGTPAASVVRNRSPDWGIDFYVSADGNVRAYQCKHYRGRLESWHYRDIEESVMRACISRKSSVWHEFVLVLSRDLTPMQRTKIVRVLDKHVPHECRIKLIEQVELQVLLTTYPDVWEYFVDSPVLRIARCSRDVPKFCLVSDAQLSRVIREYSNGSLGAKTILMTLLEVSVTRMNYLNDWYLVALDIVGEVFNVYRAMSSERELNEYWTSSDGNMYFKMNKRFIEEGKQIYRLFVCSEAADEFRVFRNQLALQHMFRQQSIGINCRVILEDVYNARRLFGADNIAIQDDMAVFLYHNSEDLVQIVTNGDIVADSISGYDELYYNHAISLSEWEHRLATAATRKNFNK